MLRLPDSGGVLVDGKQLADAIRANPDNPDERGRSRRISRRITVRMS